jgi:excisionase family DNA binding protein
MSRRSRRTRRRRAAIVGFLTTQQAANELGVTAQTILNWIEKKEIAAKVFGPRTIRIPVDEWERFKGSRPGYMAKNGAA